jgi:hypothetical protein
LVRWDADNSVAYLFEAQRIAAQLRASWREESRGANHPSGASPPEQIHHNGYWIDKGLSKDARWLAAMDQAIAAPRFDSYVIRHSELIRNVMNRQKIEKPSVAMLGIMETFLPSLSNFSTYMHVLLERGERAEYTGNWKAAEECYWRVAHFGERLRIQNQSDFEARFARSFQENAYGRMCLRSGIDDGISHGPRAAGI